MGFYKVWSHLQSKYIVLNFPEPSLIQPRLSGTYYKEAETASIIILEINRAFDPAMTLFANDDNARQALKMIGFVGKIYVPADDLQNERWTFSNGKYITYVGNTMSFYNADDTLAATDGFNLGSQTASSGIEAGLCKPSISASIRIATEVNHGGDTPYDVTIPSVYGIRLTNVGQRALRYQYSNYNDGNGGIYLACRFGQNIYSDELIEWWSDVEPDISEPDPYANAGESEPSGPDIGDFDFTSTDIPTAGVPTIGAMDTGFIGLYKPSASDLKDLANYMWSGAFDIASLKKLFADPMDCILGLQIVPTSSDGPATTPNTLVVGNISTEISMPMVTSQYYQLNCGTLNIPAKWGAYLDYSPYTKLSLYLPYIGYVDISPDDCMRGSINVKYTVDVLSGTCTAQVYCVSNRGADGHTLYTFNGSCGCECPITEGQYKTGALGVLEAAVGVGQMAAGNVLGGLGQTFSAIQSMVKPEVKRSGGFGGSAGLMAIQYPYLILTVPRMCIPGSQNTYIGYPSFVTKLMAELHGYTQIEVSHLNNMSCTEAETAEIISLLGEGVIF